MEKYDQIGVGYNQTRKADHYLLGRMIHFLDTKPGGVYLDIGCGTGNYTIAFSNRGVKLIGMDGILAVLTTHHWTNQNKGYAELGRVLKPGGTIVIFTATPEQMKSYWLSHYFPKMLQDGRKQMLPYETIEENLLTGGFTEVKTEKYFVTNDLQDLFLQCGKYNPAIYLDEQVRRGISSFATAKNAEEVQSGLASLRSDIDSGNIEEVVKQYESEVGDYLFVIAKKS